MSTTPSGSSDPFTRRSRKGSKSAPPGPPTCSTPPSVRLQSGRKSPYLWAVTEREAAAPIAGQLEAWQTAARSGRLSRETLQDVESWLETAIEHQPAEPLRALQALELLPLLFAPRHRATGKKSKRGGGEGTGADEGAEAAARRIAVGRRVLERITAISEASDAGPAEPTWWRLLSQIELPLAAAATLDRPRGARARFDGLRERAHQILEAYCDTDGIPTVAGLETLRPILACLVRSAHAAEAIGIELLVHELGGLFDGLVEQSLRLSAHDRTALGGDRGPFGWSKRLARQLLDRVGDDELRLLAYRAWGVGRREAASYVESLRSASTASAWAETALLRSDWSRKGAKLLLTHADGKVGMELETTVALLSGEWTLRLDRNGRRLKPIDDWSVVCWHDDDGVAYLELELEFEGAKIQRQALLSKEDRVLFLADALLADDPASWDYRATLSMAAGTEFAPAVETREGMLTRSDNSGETTTVAAVVPLGLPEWRRPATDAGLERSDRELVSFAHFEGRRAYFPLFLDLQGARASSPLTWRRLTVGEQLRICDAETAVAYRVQVGWEQWIFYRSLAEAANRTFFGQNLVADFFAGQFDAEGIVNDLLSIEEGSEDDAEDAAE